MLERLSLKINLLVTDLEGLAQTHRVFFFFCPHLLNSFLQLKLPLMPGVRYLAGWAISVNKSRHDKGSGHQQLTHFITQTQINSFLLEIITRVTWVWCFC